MADKIVLADTSLLIEYFRKTDKNNSTWFALIDNGYDCCIPAITEYEIYSGATQAQLPFWNDVLKVMRVLPFDKIVAQKAVELNSNLKRKRKQIDLPDLFIEATAVTHELPIATLNRKRFEHIDGLEIIMYGLITIFLPSLLYAPLNEQSIPEGMLCRMYTTRIYFPNGLSSSSG